MINSLSVFAAVMLMANWACAQSYPAKPIRVIVPFPAGGGIDAVARQLAPKLAEVLGQSLIIDNRVGASGTVGTEAAAKSTPDGYTLLATFASHAQNATLYRNLGYDTQKSFASISLIATVPNFLVAHPSLPIRTVKDLIVLAKARPGQILYASIGNGTPAHLSAEMLKSMAGIDLTHVPYKGGAPSIIALVAGETQLTITTVLLALPHVKSGRLRSIAVASLKRSSVIPDVPTIDESGVKGYDSNAWYAFFVPARTPQEIVARLNQVTANVIRTPDIRERLLLQGAEPAGGPPEELDKLVRDDIVKWGAVVRKLGLTAD
ncbi:MAG TPA: tripartite tricarboxylate transporter substrate binding protein [Burkholderiales bacterium]|nr:tripartite tricarboxylate transporter substrate binding protein [Burkholderiales bacterium]